MVNQKLLGQKSMTRTFQAESMLSEGLVKFFRVLLFITDFRV